MTMQRRNDWKPRLRQFLDEQGDKQFQFGQQDCGSLAGGAIEAMTGENPHAKVAGRYKTMAGALRALKQLEPHQTGMSLEDEMTVLEMIEQHPDFSEHIADEARTQTKELHAAAAQ